ncbi:hypothetical protein H8K38_11415 [Undibacterium sp. FT79W]|uniref:LolA family protein n=1 Tax=Undibacterium sp. FT79W TaxID=2762296 RepID=UPI00164C3564|nr:hypothetical protein [Undibacterium sp. FT79W]MBC3878422.1 hypothetical protein [Undibacterium sp. FT79W]
MNKHHLKAFIIGTAFVISCQAEEINPDKAISTTPSSLEVLGKVAGTYKGMNSYQDKGVSFTEFKSSGTNYTIERHFTTTFSRPDQFRFEFTQPAAGGIGTDSYVVWMKNKEVKSWWTIGSKVEAHESLGHAISGATGVSGGTAYTIPSILLNEAAWKNETWVSTSDSYRIDDGIERGIDCFRVQRLTSTKANVVHGIEIPSSKGKVTYWVSKTDYLLLRIDEETNFGSFSTFSKVQYFPIFNTVIPDEAFNFGH